MESARADVLCVFVYLECDFCDSSDAAFRELKLYFFGVQQGRVLGC